MKLHQLLLFLLSTPLYISSEQFIYPVSSIDHEGKEILVVYQKSLDDIELWIWDTTTQRAIKGLLSAYIPAGIKMLPSGVGFSFIDEGRLRVKNFYKRLPKTIAIYEPISKITDIYWISDDAFYFSAKEGNAYNIFSSNTLGEVQRCTSGQDFDYVYPSKIGRTVFCIERQKDLHIFKIVKILWELCAYDSKSLLPQIKETLLTNSQPISYLHMISDEEGFYLDYSSVNFQSINGLLLFTCCRIFKDSNQDWQTESLFEFKIPASYVIGKEESRLYESIQPLLPQYTDHQCVYFIDADNEGALELKKYNIQTKDIEVLKSYMRNGLQCYKFISPVIVGKNVYTGFVVDEENIHDRMIDIDGSIFLDLPELSIESFIINKE